jgi:hypothetical protein
VGGGGGYDGLSDTKAGKGAGHFGQGHRPWDVSYKGRMTIGPEKNGEFYYHIKVSMGTFKKRKVGET